MFTPRFASHVMCVAVITLTSFGSQLIAQDHGATSLFERVHSMPVAAAEADSKNIEFHGIVRQPDFTEAQAVLFCISAEPSKTTTLGKTTTSSRGRFSFSLSASEEQLKHLMAFALASCGK